ncbi:hypothetical protein STAQ_20820 [Allostella sp. ATCC 35155]|nr:hypothetical protein STAQ_20820 [Stella sp. ATCC 35155]
MAPTDALYRSALAVAHAGRIPLLVRRCEAILAADPEHAGALRLLAYARRRAGNTSDALDLLTRAARAAPREGRIALELGHLLSALGHADDAIAAYAEAARLRPTDLGAGLALVAGLRRLGRRSEAIAACQPLAARSTDRGPRAVLSAMLREEAGEAAAAGAHQAAAARLQRVVALGVAQAGDFSNLGSALQELGRWPEAEAALRRAATLAPRAPEIRANLANLLMLAGRYPEAVAEYAAADRIDPGGTARSYNFGHALAGAGRLAEAWTELDRHWSATRTRRHAVPEWDGAAAVDGVLLWSEHGIGDEVLSLGMAQDAAARTGRLVIECDPRLLPAVRRSMPDIAAVARGGPPPAIAAHLPASRLPGLFRPNLGAFPDRAAYLSADAGRVADLAARYRRDHPGLVVGIAWRSTNAAFGHRKSIPLADWHPLFARRPARWISLQHGDCAAEITAAGGQVHVDPDIDPVADIDGLMAQIAAVDLVIAASNSTAHLAGALGRPCWVLLPRGSGLLWHWLVPAGGDRSPWYPSVRLFRSDGPNDWTAPIARAADTLETFGG